MKKLSFKQSLSTKTVASPYSVSRRELLKLAGTGVALSAVSRTTMADVLFTPSIKPSPASLNFGEMAGTHDLALPDWGPYSKRYFGISHITDVNRGISFDFSIFPWIDKEQSKLPSVLSPGGVHPWIASTDISFYTLREQLIWKDRFYCDLSFITLDDHSRLIRMEFVNHTDQAQHCSLGSLAQLSYPPRRGYSADPIRLTHVDVPPGAVWVHALDYADLRFAKPRPTDNLVQDGVMRGEERVNDSITGSVIGQNFGRDAGDAISYRISLNQPFEKAVLVWHFLGKTGDSATFQLRGSVDQTVTLQGTGSFSTVAVPLGKLGEGSLHLDFAALGGPAMYLDGFAIVEEAQASTIRFDPAPWRRDPAIDTTSVPDSTILSYQDIDTFYGVRMSRPLVNERKLVWTQFDDVFGVSDSRTRELQIGNPANQHVGDPDCIFVTASSAPLAIPPHGNLIVHGIVCTGSRDDVRASLRSFDPHSPAHEALYSAENAKAYRAASVPAGEPYQLSQHLLATVTVSNLVFPIYAQRQYIRHYTPGRNWDSLYTWDDGFIGLGLLECDPRRAIDILNAYTTPPGAQSAFLLHGTPLPIQIFLFAELWNRTRSREMLVYFYPRVQQFYEFIAGRLGSSTTRQHKDHLLCTWDYFYNTGGWDDYSPQRFVHEHKLESSTAPVVSSAYMIRCAKLLRMAAAALGRTQDFATYDQDIAILSGSLQKYSWDEAAGYFGYVTHDLDGTPKGILREPGGANFNMGIDGVTPLNAGICTPTQEQALLERIFSKAHLWTDIGITTISQSAPYYNPDGYWNGSVWMAHQWFLWKTMFDLGRADLAIQIADTGLRTWKKSTDETYNCYEHFSVKTGKGSGWPQFSSLSSPVLPWFGSLYTPGRLTCGFEVWLETCEFSDGNGSLFAKLRTSARQPGKQFSVLACMNPRLNYRASWNGKPVPSKAIHDGLLQLDLPYSDGIGELKLIGR
jgi:hypothetical protein